MADTTRPVALRNALVVDGTGRAGYRQDVLVAGNRVETIGHVEPSANLDEIDLTGLVLTPGFIDIHTHYDAQVTWDPDLTPSPWHGVTTVLTGNCGFGIAPCAPADREVIVGTLENVEGMSAEALSTGISWSFETFGEYLDAVERQRPRVNVAVMLGHTPLRLAVMGLEASEQEATPHQLDCLADLVDEGLDAGAWGFASSKSENHQGYRGRPVPSRAAGYDEIERLASRVPAGAGALVQAASGPGLFVEDFARLARTIDTPVTWTALLTGVGRSGTARRLLDRASDLGGPVWPQISCRPLTMQFDLSDPAPFGRLPAFEDVLAVERDARRAVYLDGDWRARARRDVDARWPYDWAHVTLEESEVHTGLADGATIEDLARQRGEHPLDVVVDLGLQEDLATRFRVVLANHDEEELALLLDDERCVLGLSDAGAHASQLCDACFSTHLLGYWVREKRALTLEKAVWRLTGQPARLFGFRDRGELREGAIADLVAFDPAAVGAGTVRRVHDLPAGADRLLAMGEGIEWVWVNGQAIRRDGVDVDGLRPGLLLRSS